MSNDLAEKQRELYDLCKTFIEESDIGHPETIYQCDHVIEGAYSFIEQIADIVGYAEHCDEVPDEED